MTERTDLVGRLVGEAPQAASLSGSLASTLSARIKALSAPARVRLLALLADGSRDGTAVRDLTVEMGLSQPTISHHLRVLEEAGLVVGEKVGVWRFYRLNVGEIEELGDTVANLAGSKAERTQLKRHVAQPVAPAKAAPAKKAASAKKSSKK